MDTNRFDTIAKALGAGSTRRGVIASLSALAIGAGIGGEFAASAAATDRRGRGRARPKVTDGSLDGEAHPYVGLMVAQDKDGNPLWRCSGTLLSPTLFVTAGHCTESPAAHAEIWFASDVDAGIPGNGYPYSGETGGATQTHPQFDPARFYAYDLGVVVLDEARSVPMAKYGQLPALDELDGLTPRRGQKDQTFTAVGYGMQKSFPDAASWKDEAKRVRMTASPRLLQINTGFTGDGSIMLSNNARTGGTCYGDSGGPNFVGTSRTIGGVTSFALNGTCAGTGGVYRIDRKDDLDWLKTFLT